MATINITKENDIILVSFDKDVKKFNALITEEVKQELLVLFDNPNTKLILNLSGINYVDSSGFGVFLSLMKKANNNYGSFKICTVNSDVKELFQLLQLHNVFEIYENQEKCIASFS